MKNEATKARRAGAVQHSHLIRETAEAYYFSTTLQDGRVVEMVVPK